MRDETSADDAPTGQDLSAHSTPSRAVPKNADAARHIALRILATTDMHMNLLPWDYFHGRSCHRRGLAQVGSLIAQLRAGRRNCLLFDNGDFLEGTPLGDYAASGDTHGAHPAIAAMNGLGYDAVALGNHDFTFGLSFLERVLATAHFPTLLANAQICAPAPDAPAPRPAWHPWQLLQRRLFDDTGQPHELRIGVIGFAPPQTANWDGSLQDLVRFDDIIDTARREIPKMRAAGADLIIALAHSGIGQPEPSPMMENAAAALGRVEGIDAIIAGHTHSAFPHRDFPASPGIDPIRGTVHGVPIAMAGFWGSHLARLDLTLSAVPPQDGATSPSPDARTKWRVTGFDVAAEPVVEQPSAPEVVEPTLPAHRATLRHYRSAIAQIERPIHSYFAMIGHDNCAGLIAEATSWHAKIALRNHDGPTRPILTAATSFRAGGWGGPDQFTYVPAGPLRLGHLADIYLFTNRLAVVEASGADLADWLERAGAVFAQLTPAQPDQDLRDPRFPGYHFDVIDGLSYRYDLRQPARYDVTGTRLHNGPGRLRDLCHQGQPVAPEDRFWLVTNSYRRSGSGLYAGLAETLPCILDAPERVRDILHRYVLRKGQIAGIAPQIWDFAPMPGCAAVIETSPAARDHLPDAGRPLTALSDSDQGFARFRVTF